MDSCDRIGRSCMRCQKRKYSFKEKLVFREVESISV